MKQLLKKSVIVFLVIALSGCSSSPPSALSVEHHKYDGLPTELVQEVLNSPGITERSSDRSDEQLADGLQLQIFLTGYCRELYSEYQGWTLRGESPQLPAIPTPDNPGVHFLHTLEIWHEDTEESIRSGDPEKLKEELLMLGGCRDFTVEPAAQNGETIADALLAGN